MSGIKWKRLSSENLCENLLEDPVLTSYYKCLAGDLLCVWRRVDNGRNSFDHQGRKANENQISFLKELWIFWYGEDPDLNDLVSSELTGKNNNYLIQLTINLCYE